MSQPRIRLLDELRKDHPDFVAVDWPAVVEALTAFICSRFRATDHQIIGRSGKTGGELALEAVEDLIIGKVEWRGSTPWTTKAVIGFLCRVVMRDGLDQACRRVKGKRKLLIDDSLDSGCCDNLECGSSSETAVILAEGDGTLRRLFEDLERRPDSHPKFEEYVRLQVASPLIKPRHVAIELDIPIEEANNMRKRLERRLRHIVPASSLQGRPGYERKEARRQMREHHG